MYNDFFHFSEQPFSIAPDPHFMFMSTRHQEGLAHLLYGINHGGGFVALTGEVGTGKTTLCNCLLQQLPENINIALVLNPKLNALELLATLCDELGISYDAKQQSLKYLVDTLNRYLLDAHANNRRTVLMIDEAQNLTMEVLEQIRLLTNLETRKTKLLQIILVGQPELNELLNRRELRQLNQRITARYHLAPLSLEETRAYINHRLRVCKGDAVVFKEKAIQEIFKFSKGIPRVINIICHCALLGAYSAEARVITPAIIRRAAGETLGQRAKEKGDQVKPLLLLLLLACIGAGVYHQETVMGWRPSGLIDAFVPSAAETRLSATKQQAPIMITPHPAVKPAQASVEKPFKDWLENAGFTLEAAIADTLALWGKADDSAPTDCKHVQSVGLSCYFEHGNWKDLVTFNRPVIMEFSLPDTTKRYALLVSIKNDRLVFQNGQSSSFALADVLSLWDGYYLLVWQPPKSTSMVIKPGETSDRVIWLRDQLARVDGLNPAAPRPDFFDNELRVRVINFQNARQLQADGEVGSKTLFYLDAIAGAKNPPYLKD